MGGMMGSMGGSTTTNKSETSNTSSSSTYRPDEAAYSAYKGLLPAAQSAADAASTFNGTQNQAFQQLGDLQGQYKAGMDAANAYTAAGAGPISSASINNYMNPYQQNVIDATMANLQHSYDIQNQNLKGNAIAQGALGGSRAKIAQAEQMRNQAATTAQTLAGLNQSNYNQALSAAQGDAARQMAAGAQTGNLTQMGQNLGLQGTSALLQAGNQQQQLPLQTLQWLANLQTGVGSQMGGTTSGTSTGTTTGTSTTKENPGMGQMIGTGLSALAMFSDERMKEGIEPVGKSFDGQTIYKFNYKGDPKTQIGFLAQEVEHHHPEAVGSIGGLKTVNYDTATRDAAHRGHFADGGDVGFGGFQNTLFPTGQIAAHQSTIPALPTAQAPQLSASSGQQRQQGNLANEMKQWGELGKGAKSGLSSLNDSLGKTFFGSTPETGAGGWQTSTEPSGGFIGGLGSMFGFASGGEVHPVHAKELLDLGQKARRHISDMIFSEAARKPKGYDDGGEVGYPAGFLSGLGDTLPAEDKPFDWNEAWKGLSPSPQPQPPVVPSAPAAPAESVDPGDYSYSYRAAHPELFGGKPMQSAAPAEPSFFSKIHHNLTHPLNEGRGLLEQWNAPPKPAMESPAPPAPEPAPVQAPAIAPEPPAQPHTAEPIVAPPEPAPVAASAVDNAVPAPVWAANTMPASELGNAAEPAPAGAANVAPARIPNTNNATTIVNELRAAGASDNAIRGVLANVQDESGFVNNLRHPDQPRFGGEAHYAHGFFQIGGDEWNQYDAWLKKNHPGADWSDPVLQTKFMAENLQQNYPGVWKAMNEGSAEDAARAYLNGYLKPAERYRVQRNERYGRGVGSLDDLTADVPTSAASGSGGFSRSGAAREVSSAPVASPDATSMLSFAKPQEDRGGLIKRLFGVEFNPLKLTDNERMGLLAAGLGMMGDNINPFRGAAQGVQIWNTLNQQDLTARQKAQEMAMEAQKMAIQQQQEAQRIGIQQQQLGIHQQQVNQAKKQFTAIGHDALGNPVYGFVDSSTGSVIPAPAAPGSYTLNQGGDDPITERAKRVIAGQEAMPAATKGDKTALAVQAKVRELDKTYAANRFQYRQGYEDANKGVQKSLGAFATALHHAETIHDATDNLSDTGMGAGNSVYHSIQRQFGNTALKNYEDTATALGNELDKAFVGGVGTGKERSEAQERVSSSLPKQAIRAGNAANVELMIGKMLSFENQWRKTMGANVPPPASLSDDERIIARRIFDAEPDPAVKAQRYKRLSRDPRTADLVAAPGTGGEAASPSTREAGAGAVQLKAERPKGKTDAQIIEAARQAIAQGKPKELIERQLAQWGLAL